MFGTITPNTKRLGPDNKKCYHGYYCGLCFALGDQFGLFARFLLNYDLTNEYLLAACAAKQTVEEHTAACPCSPFRRRVRFFDIPELSEYFARLNYLLVYCKLLDDQADDHSRLAAFISARMQSKMDSVIAALPNETRLLKRYLEELHEIEKKNEMLPVYDVAQRFGVLMQYLAAPPLLQPLDREVFGRINYWTGVWIYSVDAMKDCYSDYLKKRYNPILAGTGAHPFDVAQVRKNELLEIVGLCRDNIQNLLQLYPAGQNSELLKRLFDLRLPFAAKYLLGGQKSGLNN